MNIAILSPIDQEAIAQLQQRYSCSTTFPTTAADLPRLLANADVAVVRSGVRLDQAALAAAPCLKLIVRAGAGLDGIDQEYARQHGITLLAVSLSVEAVAEHTFALLLSLARKVPFLDRQLRAGRWDKQRGTGIEIGGRCLGLLGFGKIGRRTAEIARAFGMTVLAHDRSPDRPNKQQAAVTLGVRFVPLEELFSTADVVVIQVPLTNETRGLVGADLLSRMRPTALLINVGRGQIVDETALYEALRQGRLGGAALDVFAREPVGEHPLLSLDNFLGTPHVAGQTLEAQQRIGAAVVQAIDRFAQQSSSAVSASAR